MTEYPPEHPRISPEEAARLIKQGGEIELLSEQEIASGLRDHVLEYGANEVEIGGVIYTVEAEGEEPEGDDPDLLVRFVERLFEREPGLRSHFASAVTLEITEELMRRGSATCAKRVMEIEQDWEMEQ